MKENDRVLCTCKDRRQRVAAGGRKERKKPTPGRGGMCFFKTVFLQERSFSLCSHTLALPHRCRHRSTHNTSGDAKQT